MRYLACLAVLAPALTGQALAAGTTIGEVAMAQRSVTSTLAGRQAALARGDGVAQDALVRTGAESAAKLVFLDKTNLSLGAQASVVLDRFVYDAERGAVRELTVDAAKGAFRWVSGTSPSQNYAIRTPVAIVGVRGTVFDMLVRPGRTIVVLREGAINVCTRDGRRCKDVTVPGHMVVVSRTGIAGPRPGGPKAFNFADSCTHQDGACAAPRPARPSRPPPPPRGPVFEDEREVIVPAWLPPVDFGPRGPRRPGNWARPDRWPSGGMGGRPGWDGGRPGIRTPPAPRNPIGFGGQGSSRSWGHGRPPG